MHRSVIILIKDDGTTIEEAHQINGVVSRKLIWFNVLLLMEYPLPPHPPHVWKIIFLHNVTEAQNNNNFCNILRTINM